MIQFSNKVYDVMKWLCLIFSPALITLISALSAIYGYDATKITGVITAVTAFIGALIGISTITYNREGSDKDE